MFVCRCEIKKFSPFLIKSLKTKRGCVIPISFIAITFSSVRLFISISKENSQLDAILKYLCIAAPIFKILDGDNKDGVPPPKKIARTGTA